MSTTYFVEERSGVIGPQFLGTKQVPRQRIPWRDSRIDWCKPQTWCHLIVIILSICVMIASLAALHDLIESYSGLYVYKMRSENQQAPSPYHPLGLTIAISAIMIYWFGGLFALTVDVAAMNESYALFAYLMAYLISVIFIFHPIISYSLLHPIWIFILIILAVLYGFGFWRFTIISSIYLNEEGPTWFKPLLYGCLAAIPILTTSSQCRDAKNVYGCLPNDYFGDRVLYNDFYSFGCMTAIAIVSAIPFLLGIPHKE